jgi:putative hydrolase of the HAD superfamily
MPGLRAGNIRGIIFDLDGTLYVCEAFADTIQDAALTYMAGLLEIKQSQACQLMADTRQRLAQENGTLPTLSAVCSELGGDIKELHRCFTEILQPEEYLLPDQRVTALLRRLAARFSLYLYTNNNRALATRILTCLGLEDLFQGIFAIDDAWLAKPDERALADILAKTALAPAEALFVGDRYDVDLRLPEQFGCPVYLTRKVEQLLRLEELLIGHNNAA